MKPIFKYVYTHIHTYDMKAEDREGTNDMREGRWVVNRNEVWVR